MYFASAKAQKGIKRCLMKSQTLDKGDTMEGEKP